MILVFVEDGTLEIVEGLEEARRNYEGIDVESGVYEFYDEKGIYLKPIFTKPNKINKLFWLFSSIVSGEYILEPAPNEGEDIITALKETIALTDNRWFKNLDEVKKFLTSASTSTSGTLARPSAS